MKMQTASCARLYCIRSNKSNDQGGGMECNAAFPDFQHKVMAISSEIADGLHVMFGHNPCGGRVYLGATVAWPV